MASSSSAAATLHQQQQQQLCTVCDEPLTGDNTAWLPCLHVICASCLKDALDDEHPHCVATVDEGLVCSTVFGEGDVLMPYVPVPDHEVATLVTVEGGEPASKRAKTGTWGSVWTNMLSSVSIQPRYDGQTVVPQGETESCRNLQGSLSFDPLGQTLVVSGGFFDLEENEFVHIYSDPRSSNHFRHETHRPFYFGKDGSIYALASGRSKSQILAY